MMGSMLSFMLLGFVVLAALIGTAVYVAVRAGSAPLEKGPDARTVLRERLADGSISAEEYYERDSALRES